MAITYEIKINGARVSAEGDLADVVKELDVTVTGKDGAAQFALPTTLKLGEPDATAFTAFAELTEAQLVEWVEAETEKLEPIKAHIAYVVAKEVEKQVLTVKPLPWAPVPEAAPMAPDMPPAE